MPSSVGREARVEEQRLAEGHLLRSLRVIGRDRGRKEVAGQSRLVERFGLGWRAGFDASASVPMEKSRPAELHE